MTLKIVVATSVDGDLYEMILTQEKYRVGRCPDNDLRVKETYISGYHSEIRRTGSGDYELVDLESANGTFLNGDRVEAPVRIKAGDFIKFGILKVAVKEHGEKMPQVVPLKDRPVFAKKRTENPSKAALSSDTGAVENEETVAAAVSGNVLSPGDNASTAKLKSKIESLEKELDEKNREVANVEKQSDKIAEFEKQLTATQAELETATRNLEAANSRSEVLSGKLSETEAAVARAKAFEEVAAEREQKIGSLQDELAALRKTVSEREEELASTAKEAAKVAALAASVAALEEQLDAATSEGEAEVKKLRTALDAETVRANDRSFELEKLKEAHERETADWNESTKSLNQENATLAEELETLKEELKQGGEKIDRLKAEVEEKTSAMEKASIDAEKAEKLVIQVEELTSSLENTETEYKTKLETAGSQRDELEKELEATREKAAARNLELEMQVASLTDSLEKETATSSETFGRLAATLATVEKIEAEKSSVEAELTALRNDNIEAEEHFARLSSELANVESARDQLESELESEQARATAAATRNESLSSQLAEIVGQLEKTRDEITGLRNRNDELSRNNGRIQAQLDNETTRKSQFRLDLANARERADQRLTEIEDLQEKVAAKEREVAEAERSLARSESDAIREIRFELSEAKSAVDRSEKEAAQALEEKQELSGAYDRLKKQLSATEAERDSARVRESEILETNSRLSDQLEESETTNAELTARIEEEASHSVASRELVEKLEAQLRENESASQRREKEQASVLQSEIDSLSARLEEEERQRTFVGESLARESSERKEANTRILELEERIAEFELKLGGEEELRGDILTEFDRTKAGLSDALHSNRVRLFDSESTLEFEKELRHRAEQMVAEQKKEIERLHSQSAKDETRFTAQIKDWEERFNLLREEKLTLTSDNASLKTIRDRIEEAATEKEKVEAELFGVKAELNKFMAQRRELQIHRKKLLKEQEGLKVALNDAREELETSKERQGDSRREEEKLARSIVAAERRIQSLKKLEKEIEQAVERKRQKSILSRNGVFSNGSVLEEPTPNQNGMIRDEEFCRKLIGKLDLLDDLTKRYENKWRYPKVAEQLTLLKKSFLDLLNDHSVRAFDLEPGTVLSVNERRRIRLVPLPNKATRIKSSGQNGSKQNYSSRVIETVRSGYIYQHGSKDIVIRKADVIVA